MSSYHLFLAQCSSCYGDSHLVVEAGHSQCNNAGMVEKIISSSKWWVENSSGWLNTNGFQVLCPDFWPHHQLLCGGDPYCVHPEKKSTKRVTFPMIWICMDPFMEYKDWAQKDLLNSDLFKHMRRRHLVWAGLRWMRFLFSEMLVNPTFPSPLRQNPFPFNPKITWKYPLSALEIPTFNVVLSWCFPGTEFTCVQESR